MNALPSISSQIDEDKIFKIINKNFSKIAPSYYNLITSWLSRSYNVFQDIDKFVILIYFINKDLIFFRKNGLVINYDTFYNDKSIEIPKINISDISNDLKIPKESVRRKLQELEKKGIIKKTGKKIFVDRSAFTTAKAEQTLKELSILISKFNEILVEEKVTNIIFNTNEISESIKTNFSFCWYQFYKFLFSYTKRLRTEVNDLETLCIGMTVVLNAVQNKEFVATKKDRLSYHKEIMGSDLRGVNAMSISDITGIPRPTVVRKLKWLIDKKFLTINDKKLISLDVRGSAFNKSINMQKQNMLNLSNFIYRLFNQIKVINS